MVLEYMQANEKFVDYFVVSPFCKMQIQQRLFHLCSIQSHNIVHFQIKDTHVIRPACIVIGTTCNPVLILHSILSGVDCLFWQVPPFFLYPYLPILEEKWKTLAYHCYKRNNHYLPKPELDLQADSQQFAYL